MDIADLQHSMLERPYRINKNIIIGEKYLKKGTKSVDTWSSLSKNIKTKLFVSVVCNEVSTKYIISLVMSSTEG